MTETAHQLWTRLGGEGLTDLNLTRILTTLVRDCQNQSPTQQYIHIERAVARIQELKE